MTNRATLIPKYQYLILLQPQTDPGDTDSRPHCRPQSDTIPFQLQGQCILCRA